METLPELIQQSIHALVAWDVTTLDRLRLEIQATSPEGFSSETLIAVKREYGLLGAVLEKAEQNLRLFRNLGVRTNAGVAGSYDASFRNNNTCSK